MSTESIYPRFFCYLQYQLWKHFFEGYIFAIFLEAISRIRSSLIVRRIDGSLTEFFIKEKKLIQTTHHNKKNLLTHPYHCSLIINHEAK